MKKIKKFLAILLSVILSVSLFGICASAEGTPVGDESMTVTITTDKETYAVEENVIVSVSMKSNYNVTCFRFPIMFDASVYELPTVLTVSAKNTCALNNATVGSNVVKDGSSIPSNYTASDFGCVLFQWTATVSNNNITAINNPDGEVCFTFVLKTKSSAAGKTGTIFIPPESDKFYYQAVNDTTDASTFYYLSAETCAMSFVPANATVIGEEVALVPVDENSTAVIDEENLYVTGLAEGLSGTASIKAFVKSTGNSSLRCTPAEFGYGTGTLINIVVDSDIVKTYKVIIYGDLTGDSAVDSLDLTFVSEIVSGVTSVTDQALIIAGDLYHDNDIDALDMSPLASAVAGISTIDQVNPY